MKDCRYLSHLSKSLIATFLKCLIKASLYPDKILPLMYESVKKKIGSEINKETDLVFTWDI
uniref:Uncharacterized protein n=1 Tax=Romanomermis culicivorax TaxID=13658 RepID=A0A915I8V7_ROMCU